MNSLFEHLSARGQLEAPSTPVRRPSGQAALSQCCKVLPAASGCHLRSLSQLAQFYNQGQVGCTRSASGLQVSVIITTTVLVES
jgi:hypothetical protein